MLLQIAYKFGDNISKTHYDHLMQLEFNVGNYIDLLEDLSQLLGSP